MGGKHQGDTKRKRNVSAARPHTDKSERPLRPPGLPMRLVIVIPAPPRGVRPGFPLVCFGGFNMPIAEDGIGVAVVAAGAHGRPQVNRVDVWRPVVHIGQRRKIGDGKHVAGNRHAAFGKRPGRGTKLVWGNEGGVNEPPRPHQSPPGKIPLEPSTL